MTADTWTKTSEQAVQREQVSDMHREEGVRREEREGGEEGDEERGDKMKNERERSKRLNKAARVVN